jgi:hypothetical protein
MRNYYKFRISALLSLMMFILIGNHSLSQVNTYSMTPISGAFNEIVGGTATSLTATADDDISASFPIGFNFVYDGVTYTSLRASSNGLLTFNATGNGGAGNVMNTATTTFRPSLAPLWDDLQCSSGVTYQLSGVAPNQVLTVQWLSMEWNWSSSANVISFQVKLYESTNVIDFVYRSEAAAGNPGGSGGASIGLMGTLATDFLSLLNTSAAPTVSTTAANNAISTKPATGQIYRFVAPPATPPTPTQALGIPSCATGTDLDLAGPPPADVTWYWQTSATGTSTANPYTGPYTVFANGTYYARAYNTVTLAWSTNSSSYTVSNFPVATSPVAPVATVNPSCAPAGSTLTIDPAPANTEYYWQGTTLNGTSTALPATAPYAYTTSGTYYVAAYDLISSCWSNTTAITVTVDNAVPGTAIVAQTDFNYCSGATSAPVTAQVPLFIGTNEYRINFIDSWGDGWNGNTIDVLVNGVAVLDNVTLATGTNGFQTFTVTDGDLITTQWNGGGAFIGECTYTIANEALTVIFSGTPASATGPPSMTIPYTVPQSAQPPYTLTWYNAATAGTLLGTGTPFETVGTSVMPVSNEGSYDFYVAATLGGCSSVTREMVTVNLTNVNAVLTPVNNSCNGATDGSFTLGTVECGVQPFTYSIDGGAFDPAIPTNLVAGTYSVVIQDNGGLLSAPISVVIIEPAAPANITAININYFSADVSWTTTGNETSWLIEYGPAGFTPGTGTVETAVVAPYTLTGLTEDTQYDVYVTAVCGTGSEAGGPATFSTNPGFFTFDNACGPGFTDISGTGTELIITDESTEGVTLPFTFNYQGTAVTNVTINDNGSLVFGTLTGYTGFTNQAIGAATPNGLYPFWDDLDVGSVFYETVGTAPNQMFIVQWQDRPAFFGVAGQEVTFQVIMEEATGEIYFIYDDAIFGGSQAAQDNGGSATIGVAGPLSDVQVSFNSPTYLQNNSCVHFYNALCPNPVVTSVQTFQEDIILDWAAGPYGETEWTIIYGPAGFDPTTSGTTEGGITSSDFTISGLTQITEYDIYIYSECTLDNLTSGGLLVTATTLPWCNTPTTLAGVTEVDSLFATWNWTPVASAPNVLSSFNIQYGDFGFDLYNGNFEVAEGLEFADTVANTTFLAGGVYQLYVQAVCGTDTSNYAGPYTFVMPLSNDTVCGAEMLNVDGTVYYFNNTGATVDLGENGIIPAGSNPDGYNGTILPQLTWGVPIAEGSTWFTFEAPASGSMWFSGNDQNFFASQIAIYEAADCGDFTTFDLVAASDQTTPDFSNKIAPNFTVCGLTPGQTYYVMHEAWSNGFGGAPIFGQYSIKMTPIVLEAGSFVDVLDVCSGSSVDLFDGITGNDAAGIWTAEIPAAGTGINVSDFNSAGLAYQVFNFEYRVTEGCAYDSIVSQVEIWAPSSAGNDGTIDVCRNEPFDLLSGLGGNVDMGGTWYNPSAVAMPSSATTSSNIPGQFNYNYITGNGVCPDDTALVLVNVSSTCNYLDVEEMFFGDMTVFPNPSNGVFNIANEGSTEVFNYEVTDIEGRVIATKEAAINGTSTTEIDLTGKVTGVYMIRVYNDNAEKVFRVVLQ